MKSHSKICQGMEEEAVSSPWVNRLSPEVDFELNLNSESNFPNRRHGMPKEGCRQQQVVSQRATENSERGKPQPWTLSERE